MQEFDWDSLNPTGQILFVLLTVSAVAATLTAVMMTVKLGVEWLGYKKTDKLLKVAHEILLADAQIRREVYHRTQKAEHVAEVTHDAIQGLHEKADKVERTTNLAKEAVDQVKRAVVESATPHSGSFADPRSSGNSADPRSTPRPSSDPSSG